MLKGGGTISPLRWRCRRASWSAGPIRSLEADLGAAGTALGRTKTKRPRLVLVMGRLSNSPPPKSAQKYGNGSNSHLGMARTWYKLCSCALIVTLAMTAVTIPKEDETG